MRTFQVYFATSINEGNSSGVWAIALVEEEQVIFESNKFEIEETDTEKLELSAIQHAISNLKNIRSDFRILICYEKDQLIGFGVDHVQRKESLIRELANAGYDSFSKEQDIVLNQVKNSRAYKSLREKTQELLSKELSSNYW